MKELTRKDVITVRDTIEKILSSNGVQKCGKDILNPFLFEISISASVGKAKAAKIFNELFHTLGVLPKSDTLTVGEARDYCAIFDDESGEIFSADFNHPIALGFKEGDEEYPFTIKAIFERQSAEAMAEEAKMRELVDGIKAGRLQSKRPHGYLVLAREFYDAIEAGEKEIEYRDFTEYNLKRTIGLKTVRFNRGYGSKGKPPKQMQWTVKKIVLMDDDGCKCDPFNVPEDFWPTTIAIHLGKRID